MKDTARNAVAMEEMVIHVVSEKIVSDMNETAATLAPDESELERTSFHLTESVTVSVPAIKEARIRFECKLESHLPTKNDAGSYHLICLLLVSWLCILQRTLSIKKRMALTWTLFNLLPD